MNTREFHFATVDEWFAEDVGWDHDILQLTPGRFDWTSRIVDLEGVFLEWNSCHARILVREQYHGPDLILGMALSADGLSTFRGHEIDAHTAVIWGYGREQEYIAARNIKSLLVRVDAGLVDLLGWDMADSSCQRIPEGRLADLAAICRGATLAATRAGHGAPDGPDLIWRDRILAALEGVLEPWLTPPPTPIDAFGGTRSYRLIKQAHQLFAQYDLDEPVAIDTVARDLGVPRRTLFHAFRQWPGMGPHRYLQLVRLHRLRDRLLAASHDEDSVTNLASEFGFFHTGRLAAAYREHFGENPSDTLKGG